MGGPTALPLELQTLAQIADVSADLITVADEGGRLLFASRACETMLGWSQAALVGTDLYELFLPEDRDRLWRERSERMATGAPVSARVRCGDGTYRWIESRGWTRTVGGRSYVVSIGRDVQARHEAEAQLAQESATFAAQADATTDGILVRTRGGRIVSWNRPLLTLLQLEESHLEQGSLAVLSEAIAERMADPDAYRHVFAGVHFGTQTERLELRTGRVLERTRIVPSTQAGKPDPDVVVVYRDVTAQVEAERALEQRAGEQRAIARLSQLALVAQGPEEFFGAVVEECTRLLALDVCVVLELDREKDEFVARGTNNPALRPGGGHSVSARVLAQQVIESGVPFRTDDWDTETRAPIPPTIRELGMKVGLTVPLIGRTTPLGILGAHRRDPRPFDDQALGFLSSVGNVVAAYLERERSDRALRSSEAGFRRLLEEAPDAILVQREGRILYANAVVRRLIGARDVGELRDREVLSFTHPDDRPALSLRLEEQAKSPDLRLPAMELRLLSDDEEEERFFEIVSIAAQYEGLPAVVLLGRDLTERREMQTRLLLADRMVSVGTLAAGVAHEMNNPLAYVMANLQFIAEELDEVTSSLAGPDAGGGFPRQGPLDRLRVAKQELREALDGAMRLRVVVRDLNTFSRGDGDAAGPVDLRPVVESSINMASTQLRHRARVVRRLESVPFVEGNAARLGQVALNLLVNAGQAIPEGNVDGNRVEVSTFLRGGMVCLEVKDTGGGIPPRVLPRIFDPFFTTKSPGGGTGLGLSICHKIVTSLGGRIEVESKVGQGTSFRVLLPVAARPVSSTSRPELSAARPRGRILVIDDEPLVGLAIRRALQREHEIVSVQSGKEALGRLSSGERFDGIVSDLLLPDLSGMELFGQLEQRWPQLAARTLFVTGGAFTEQARAFVARADIRSLEKPFEVERLRDAVRALLETQGPAAAPVSP